MTEHGPNPSLTEIVIPFAIMAALFVLVWFLLP
jgi:hypothetical protein